MHIAVVALNAEGVEDESQIDLSVDPSYETLDIHTLQVVRGGVVIDARKSARITVLPEETELQRRIYNGRYNVNVLLSDIRAGDVIEYAYTRHSQEKLFRGHYATTFGSAWSTPVHWQRLRLHSPAERPLRVRSSDGAPIPQPETDANGRTLTMEWHDVPAVTVDPDRPSWYRTRPYIEITDLDGWPQVARLVAGLYAQVGLKGREVSSVASAIRKAGGTPEEQALHALQYVQEKIRYTSISIGAGTHRPSPPDAVLQRGYGDCKDKSLLLVSLLAELGIDANVALVDSERGHLLRQDLPTPYAFDHAIVRIQIGRQAYWVDGTEATRYASLGDEPADFENALLVSPAAGDLVAIPRPRPDTRRRDVLVEIDARKGLSKPARMDVTTQYIGRLADVSRPGFARQSAAERHKSYGNYTARYYPGAKLVGDIEVNDDKVKNLLEVREHYTRDSAFVKNERGTYELYLHADELYSYFDTLSSSVRHAPLALDYPVHIRQRVLVLLPSPWQIEAEKVRIENPAFVYRSEVKYAARTLELTYEFEARSDHVAPEALAKYIADRKRVYDDLGYRLRRNLNAASTSTSTPSTSTSASASASSTLPIAPLPIFVLLAALAASLAGAIHWGYSFDPPARAAPSGAAYGLAGWLLLPFLGLVIRTCDSGRALYTWFSDFDSKTWYPLTAAVAKDYHVWARLALLIVVALAVARLVMNTLTVVLFALRRTSAPIAYIATGWFGIGYAILDTLTRFAVHQGDAKNLTRMLSLSAVDALTMLFWTLYMLRSLRVRATFDRRSSASASPQASAMALPLEGTLAAAPTVGGT